ncbi:MAG: sensor histidine kinase [Methanoregula sp.]|uniref:sensor histidine kinase n=1 Tax=Methanoregula sp. TaxID=2052170 RepID=UPI003D115E6F
MDLGKTPQEKDRLIQLSMLCLCIGIVSADILIPLGFVIWILYLIPLLMSVWLRHRYAPFFTAWLLTLTILLGSLISGSARANPSDLPDRAVFILMLAIVSLLVWEIKTSYTSLEAEVAERRTAQENLEVLTRTLEERVTLRTRELSEVNEELNRDIAERRRVEAALAMANRKLTLLSQITRHDISNRVFALLVELDAIKDIAGDGPVTEHLEILEKTSLAIQDQIAFTRDYQEIGSQIPVWHQVAMVIREAARHLDHGTAEISVDLDRLEIFADPMIGKVFYNLIHNALRHGGTVTRIAFSYHLSDSALVIICEDDGVGIPADEKQHIFTKGFGRDSGLGLFLIREILSITGISIKETGTEGTGARFEITVPPGDYRIGHTGSGRPPGNNRT